MVFGPRLYGEIAHHHGFARQGAESTVHLLTHLRWNNELGSLMRCVLSQLQLFSGRGQPVLECPEPQPTRNPKKGLHIYHWHHLGNGWLPSIRNYLAVIGGKHIIRDVWHPRLVRKNDIILMDQFLTEHSLTDYQTAKLNSVRL